MNSLIAAAAQIPVNDPVQTVSITPIVLEAPGRGLPLELRVTAPAGGTNLPIVVLSHGGGDSLYLPSKDGYAPIVDFWAAHGFAVVQPTHLSSKIAGFGLDPEAPGFPIFWRSRIDDHTLILDQLDEIERQAPAIAGRLDHTRIAAAGHSGGTQNVAMMLGATIADPDHDGAIVGALDSRISAGLLMGALGNGGDSLTPPVRERFPELGLDYSRLSIPTLVVWGDQDTSEALTVRGAVWHTDPYVYGPAADALLTLIGGKHFLGGIVGYDGAETDDEDPERLAIIQRMTWAYLQSAFVDGDPAWENAQEALAAHASQHARVETK